MKKIEKINYPKAEVYVHVCVCMGGGVEYDKDLESVVHVKRGLDGLLG